MSGGYKGSDAMKSILHLLFILLLHYVASVASSPKGDFIRNKNFLTIFFVWQGQGAAVVNTVFLINSGATKWGETTPMTTRSRRLAA